MTSANWTKLDITLLSGAVILLITMASVRLYTEVHIYLAARQVIANVRAIDDVVQKQYENTGLWFPAKGDSVEGALVYLDPFAANPPVYQNLDKHWLRREFNYGIVLQLVRHDEARDHVVDSNIFPTKLRTGEPYLRILVEYGSAADLETAILEYLQEAFGDDLLVKISNHLYVLELRDLRDD